MTVLTTSTQTASPLAGSARPGAYTDTDTAALTQRTNPGPAGSYVDTDAFSHLAGGAKRAGSYADTDVLTRTAPDSGRPGSYVDTDASLAARPA